MLSFFTKKRKIKIGKNFLVLNTSNPHEKKYYESIHNDDYYISKNLIKQGDKVLDLGANIGFTALLYLSFGASEVYAFEPVSSLVKRLKAIKSSKIKVFDFALSDYNGFSDIYLSTSHNQGHSLNDSWPERFGNVFKKIKREKVKVAALDSLLIDEVFNFIKIDVEGMEEKTIKGGDVFFKRNRDAIVQIEIYYWQFEITHQLLSKYYENTYIPIIENGKLKSFKNLNSFKDLSEIQFDGAPNYVYSNSLIFIEKK
ncbi:FkbM family methyltransferase [Mariniflexile sp. AS56]|uniref:FkbM family methyltransferase n=1 Tax=Mariniflexile sp. AS56 TaxID=3063957 RepID=UPI0026F3374B|nr:FkbM family methyltransferase [Mariniflexile sp. AS56]MDO7172739.1 FkbM family methyltransferase [Mariniflexile sp. AS56]